MAEVESEKSKEESDTVTKPDVKDKIIELTEEQKNFLLECEEEFQNRYTDDDPDYIKSKTMRDSDKKKPPIVEPWYSKAPRRRGHDWDKRRYDRGDRNDRGDRDNRYNRHAGRHHMHHRSSRPY